MSDDSITLTPGQMALYEQMRPDKARENRGQTAQQARNLAIDLFINECGL